MHFYQHHIGDFNNATRHLSIIERAIYRDLLDMYYEQESAIDASDLTKLQRRLLIRSTDEKQALEFVLEEFFEKQDDFYFNNRCESEIKKYQDKLETAIKAGKASAESRRKKASKKLRRDVSTKGVEDESNERSTDVKQTLNEDTPNVEPTNNHEPLTNNHKPIEGNARTNTNEFMTVDDFQLEQYTEEDIELIVQKQKKLTSQSLAGSQPIVHQPVSAVPVITQLSANQPVTKADQIRNQHAEDIEHWITPTIDEMRSELFRAGKLMQLTDDQYALHVKDFKAHYAEQALLGKPIVTESNRKAKLRKWLAGEVDKQAANQSRQEKAKGTFNIDNEDWSGTTKQYKPAQSNSDLPDGFHPSHTQPTSQAKRDPSVSVMVNGLWRKPLPGMNVQETYEYITQQQMPGEMQDEAYDRLLNQMQEAA